MAVGAFECAYEGALFGPPLPLLVFLLLGIFVGLVVPDARPHLVVHSGHSAASLIGSTRAGVRRPSLRAFVKECCHYEITGRRATLGPSIPLPAFASAEQAPASINSVPPRRGRA